MFGNSLVMVTVNVARRLPTLPQYHILWTKSGFEHRESGMQIRDLGFYNNNRQNASETWKCGGNLI